MSFILSKFFWWAAAPGNLMILALALGVLLMLLGRAQRLSRALVIGATLLGVVMAATPLRSWLLAPLEERFPPPPTMTQERVDGVIVLGGGIDSDLSRAWGGRPAFTAAADRLMEMARLARLYPNARILFTGGSASVFDDSAREADYAKKLMQDLGFEGERFIFERNSRNTWENAVFSQDLVKPKDGEVWLLVTSAYHMPRSIGIFRKIGWTVTPWPVDYSLPPDGGETPWSMLEGLDGVHWAVREWIGLAYYYAAGRSSALFPGP